MKRGLVWLLLLSLIGAGGVYSAQAVDFSSTSYKINGSIGDSIAGDQSSTNYKLSSVGGESIAGSASSGSYRLGQGYTPRLQDSIQVTTNPNNEVGYWAFENVAPGAQAFNDSALGFSLTDSGVYSTGSTSVSGKIGNAWSDSGGNNSISVPDDSLYPSGSQMTLSVWVQPSSLGTNRAIATKWDYGTNPTEGEWALQTGSSSDELRFYVGASGDSGSNYVDTTNADLTTSMTHIVVVYDGSLAAAQRVKVYVNGAQATTAVTGTIPASLNTAASNPIVFGDFPGQNRYWRGVIDEAKIFSTPLATKQVEHEYTATNAGIPASVSFFNTLTPGTPIAVESYVSVWADNPYTLAIQQNNDLTNGSNTIAPVSGSIASPISWVNGTTKGFGFSVGISPVTDPIWDAGTKYAAIPSTATSFYTALVDSGGFNDIFTMRYKLDTPSSQVAGDYTNTVTFTGTITP